MASVGVSGGGGAGASQQVQVVASHRHRRSFHLPSQQLPSNSNVRLRFKNTRRLQIRQTVFTKLASSSIPTGTGPDKPNTNHAPQPQPEPQPPGPPLLTIVAGILVFFLVSWIAGSTLMSLIAFIVRLFQSK